MKMTERWLWAGAMTGAVAMSVLPRILEPSPYWDVKLIDTYQDGPFRYITASFEKGNCERKDVVFLGLRLGLQQKLQWVADDGFDNQEDRTEGFQVLSGKLLTGDVTYEAFEIRTRHLCDGKRVDKVFLHISTKPEV